MHEKIVAPSAPPVSTPHREPLTEDQVRHHERQLIAAELLILADAPELSDSPLNGGAILWAAGRIARREVAA